MQRRSVVVRRSMWSRRFLVEQILFLFEFEFLLRVDQRGEYQRTKCSLMNLFDVGEKRSNIGVHRRVLRLIQLSLHRVQTRDQRFENDLQNSIVDVRQIRRFDFDVGFHRH